MMRSTRAARLALVAGVAALGASGRADAAVTLRHQASQVGDFVIIGNTLGHDCRSQVPAPVVGTVGACGSNTSDRGPDIYWQSSDPTSAAANNGITVGNARSTAMLTLPAGVTVTYARLYWSATGIERRRRHDRDAGSGRAPARSRRRSPPTRARRWPRPAWTRPTTTSRPPTSRRWCRRTATGTYRVSGADVAHAGGHQVRCPLRRLVDGGLLSEGATIRPATWRCSTGSTLLESGSATSAVTVTRFPGADGQLTTPRSASSRTSVTRTGAEPAALERRRRLRRDQPGEQVLQRHAVVPGRGRLECGRSAAADRGRRQHERHRHGRHRRHQQRHRPATPAPRSSAKTSSDPVLRRRVRHVDRDRPPRSLHQQPRPSPIW